MHNINYPKKCIYIQWCVNVFRHSPISARGLLATDDPPWLLCTLPYIQTRTKGCKYLLHQHLFWGRGVGFSTPKRRTELSLVFSLLHNTSDCCEIETVLPIAPRHFTNRTETFKMIPNMKGINNRYTRYIILLGELSVTWVRGKGRRVCVFWGEGYCLL